MEAKAALDKHGEFHEKSGSKITPFFASFHPNYGLIEDFDQAKMQVLK